MYHLIAKVAHKIKELEDRVERLEKALFTIKKLRKADVVDRRIG